MSPQELNLTKAAYSIDELTDIIPFGKTKLYAAIKAGDLTVSKYGKKTLVLAPDAAAFLTKLRAS